MTGPYRNVPDAELVRTRGVFVAEGRQVVRQLLTASRFRKGDLVFFGTRATADRSERISHVGMFVGNGEFLHASGLVRRNSLLPASPIYSESHRQRLRRVRRVLPQ